MKKILAAFLLVSLPVLSLFAQKSETFINSGKAIRGYDPVAYFTESKAVKGMDKYAYSYNHADWYFSSAENRELFKANPEKYAPQYGGYCAYGMSDGHKAPTDPDAWTIVNGKLYLNYNMDVKKEWTKDTIQKIQKADANWNNVKEKP